MQFNITLTRLAKGTNVPRLCRSVHITAFAAYIEYRRFVLKQFTVYESFVQVSEYHFVPDLYLGNKSEKSGYALKSFLFGIFLESRIYYGVFLVLVVGRKRKTFAQITAVKGVTRVKLDIVEFTAVFREFFEKPSRMFGFVLCKSFYRVGKRNITLFGCRTRYKLVSHTRLTLARKASCQIFVSLSLVKLHIFPPSRLLCGVFLNLFTQ